MPFCGAGAAKDAELALLPEDAPGGGVAQLADAEAGVEQCPDDEPLGGGLAGAGEAVGLLGGEGPADVPVGRRSPRRLRLRSRGPQSLRIPRVGLPGRLGAWEGQTPGKMWFRACQDLQGVRGRVALFYAEGAAVRADDMARPGSGIPRSCGDREGRPGMNTGTFSRVVPARSSARPVSKWDDPPGRLTSCPLVAEPARASGVTSPPGRRRFS